MRTHTQIDTPPPLFAENQTKKPEQFRDFAAEARASVKDFYARNHAQQTLEFVLAQKKKYYPKTQMRMGVWEALELLNSFVDASDPDTELPQIEHALQTAEAVRQDGHPDWFVLVGLMHDLGKVLSLYGEPQWAVVGDTFPVGCRYSEKNIYPEFFAANPDFHSPHLQTENGIYEPGCGLGAVHFSWGHDEYLYQVVKDYLPEEALYMVRYHSAYVIHREGAYSHLMNDHDRAMFKWVVAFNPYDLYSKSDARPDVAALKPYYHDLIAKYFPAELSW